MPKYAAHPTLYKGIMFRSRLEARWAAYFDERGWSWTYEPFDLKGYTPDFLVREGDIELLVEVKPATALSQTATPIARILGAGWKGPWMVVGADPDVCMQGVGRRHHRRRKLGSEDFPAWARACNVTQWKPESATAEPCDKCGEPRLLLHTFICPKR